MEQKAFTGWRLNLVGIAVVGLMAATGVARADLKSEIATCYQMSGDLKKLDCYDKVAKKHGLAPTSVSPKTKDRENWFVRVDKNPIDDSKTVLLATDATNIKRSLMRSLPSLFFRCASNRTEMYISWGDYLGSSAKVTFRVGQQDAVTEEWALSTDSKATFYHSSPIGLLKRLIESKETQIVAQVTPYNENPVTAIFDISGIGEVIAPLRETCSW